ncbi:hypothetical protein LTS08_003465 [Lithohypha guttulata]|nr:hypothetical protein LTS08_003465 [Lithohypha guttulata]
MASDSISWSKAAMAEEKTETRIETTISDLSKDDPPNGGWTAWSQVGAAHMITFFSWGIINSFGVFQSYYLQVLPQRSSSISWIGSIQVFLIFFIGVFSGSAFDSGWRLDVLLGTGCLLNLLGIFMMSISKTYIHYILSQGICCGIGYGLLFTPAISVVRTYFSSRRTLALGLVLSGTATGGIVIPALLRAAIPRVGFAWSVRCVGFMSLTLLPVSCYTLRRRLQPTNGGRVFSTTVLKDYDYVLYTVAMFFNLLGLFFAFFFIPQFAKSVLGFSSESSVDLLIIMNGMGMPGRLLPMWAADRFSGPLMISIPVNIVCSILGFVLLATRTTASAYVFAVLYGLFGAALIGLFPACLSSFSKDVGQTGARIGWGFSIASLAVLIGPPISGALIDEVERDYRQAQIFAACCLTIGSMTMLVMKLLQIRKTATTDTDPTRQRERSMPKLFLEVLSGPQRSGEV